MDGLPVKMRLWRLAAIAIFAAPAVLGMSARADDGFSCVRCSGPSQTYRCKVMSDDEVPQPAVNFFCMAQIAHDHVHESCGIVRNSGQCAGQDVSYVYQDGVGDQPGMAVRPESAPAPDAPPKTVADMTRGSKVEQSFKAMGDATVKAGKAVGDATVKAGQAVGDATKRTLECLGSALNAC